jgi:hypothetical protein
VPGWMCMRSARRASFSASASSRVMLRRSILPMIHAKARVVYGPPRSQPPTHGATEASLSSVDRRPGEERRSGGTGNSARRPANVHLDRVSRSRGTFAAIMDVNVHRTSARNRRWTFAAIIDVNVHRCPKRRRRWTFAAGENGALLRRSPGDRPRVPRASVTSASRYAQTSSSKGPRTPS